MVQNDSELFNLKGKSTLGFDDQKCSQKLIRWKKLNAAWDWYGLGAVAFAWEILGVR